MTSLTAGSRLRPFRNPLHWLATSFGVSAIRGSIPGTLGTVPAVGLWILAVEALGWDGGDVFWVILGMFFFGLWLVKRVGTQIGDLDDGRITWDELVGYFMAALIAPEGYWWLVAAFVLFRYVDMLKPFPVNRFDMKKTPFYVMIDDVIGGLIAGGWLWWIDAGTEWAWGLNALETLGIYIALTALVRLVLRHNRKKLVEKYHHKGPVPSIGDALSKPRTAWEPWPEGMT